MSDEVLINDEEMNQPLKSNIPLPPLDPLPEFAPIYGRISKVEFQPKIFNGKPCPRKDKEGNTIINSDGEPVYYREFKITIDLKDYALPNGKARFCWIQLTAALSGDKAKLPKLLRNLFGEEYIALQTPAEIIGALTGQDVVFQMENHISKTNKPYQIVMYNTVRKA